MYTPANIYLPKSIMLPVKTSDDSLHKVCLQSLLPLVEVLFVDKSVGLIESKKLEKVPQIFVNYDCGMAMYA